VRPGILFGQVLCLVFSGLVTLRRCIILLSLSAISHLLKSCSIEGMIVNFEWDESGIGYGIF
jgi:hypothetical protein